MFYNFCWFSCFEVCTWALLAVSVMKPFIWSHRFTSFYEYFLCLVFSTFIKAAHIKQWVTLLWFAAVEILFADKKKKGSVVHLRWADCSLKLPVTWKCSYPTDYSGKQLARESILYFTNVPGSKYQKISVVMMIQSLSRWLSTCCLLSQNITL